MRNIWNYYHYCQMIALRLVQVNGRPYMDNLAAYIRKYPYNPEIFPTYVIYEEEVDRLAIYQFFKDYEEYVKRKTP